MTTNRKELSDQMLDADGQVLWDVVRLRAIAEVWNGLNRFDKAILHRKWPELTTLLVPLENTDDGT